MATHDISLMGAVFPDVPKVILPINGGGSATFTDVSDTTATASDVMSGKLFYTADGTQTTGTATGGGGNPVRFALRPDATLVKTYSVDKYLVQDWGITLPAYSTTEKTLRASQAVSSASYTITDWEDYSYCMVMMALVLPVYASGTAMGSGQFQYSIAYKATDMPYMPPTCVRAYTNPSITSSGRYFASNAQNGQATTAIVYSSGATTINTATATLSGVYADYSTMAAGNAFSDGVIAVDPVAPKIAIKGHATYFKSAYFSALTDARVQFLYLLYKAPRANNWADGFMATNAMQRILEVIGTNDHTLAI